MDEMGRKEGNMSCERYETQMLAYMDGRATASERVEVESHLTACEVCRARVEEFRALWGVLEEVPAHEVSPTFDARLRERIAAERKPSWIEMFIPQPRLAFAAGTLLALAVWVGMLNRVQEPAIGNLAGDVRQVEEEVRKMDAVMNDFEKFSSIELAGETPRKIQESGRKL
jgi:anti-sigma factor RsiW